MKRFLSALVLGLALGVALCFGLSWLVVARIAPPGIGP
jgi:hypothetical protein